MAKLQRMGKNGRLPKILDGCDHVKAKSQGFAEIVIHCPKGGLVFPMGHGHGNPLL
jgi:hypothetical protein